MLSHSYTLSMEIKCKSDQTHVLYFDLYKKIHWIKVSNASRHVLNGIYLNCFNTKDKKDGREKKWQWDVPIEGTRKEYKRRKERT